MCNFLVKSFVPIGWHILPSPFLANFVRNYSLRLGRLTLFLSEHEGTQAHVIESCCHSMFHPSEVTLIYQLQ